MFVKISGILPPVGACCLIGQKLVSKKFVKVFPASFITLKVGSIHAIGVFPSADVSKEM